MGQFLQINGDYNIKTKDSGTITFDTGIDPSTGSGLGVVKVIGDLQVTGATTTITSVDLVVNDNIIVINDGEAGPGITKRYSGIEADRGFDVDSSQLPRAAFVYDEIDPTSITGSIGTWSIANGSSTTGYSFADSNLKVRRILTDDTYPDLILIGRGSGVVTVEGTTDYTQEIFDRVDADILDGTNLADNIITNKGYVDFAILNNPTFQIRSPGTTTAGDTRVIIADSALIPPDYDAGTPGSISYQTAETGFPTKGGKSGITFIVDDTRTAHFYSDELVLQDIIIVNNEISADQDIDVWIKTDGTGKLRINKALRMDITTDPGYISNSSLLYSKARGLGNSGLYFRSNDTSLGNVQDELISRSRALVYSMLF